MSKETYGYDKRDLWIGQKRPVDMAKKMCVEFVEMTYVWKG